MTRIPLPHLVALAALVLLACVPLGCSGGDPDLDPDVVTNLPGGDATGAAESGEYQVQLYTRACSGDCLYYYAGIPISACDVGDTDDATLMLTQTDGRLQADIDNGGLLVTRLEGGLWLDGTFDIGGYATQLAGEVEITARATGTLGAGSVTGTVSAHGWGSVDGDGIGCRATYDLSGSRQ
jgi:hypothetical protein